MVITSTPNGRFYAFRCTAGIPKLYFTIKIRRSESLNDGGGKTRTKEVYTLETIIFWLV